eukprot:TRINITY_DN2385_c2_g1_i1.p1 TRINITY_DN2385_c2_g1~~TRINITY_DN2385_c2_g1_i1.p1  ORF type:complete len:436 (+),score=64.55 TRINITY_DN2385_c2_g1_i1:99-1310(+)
MTATSRQSVASTAGGSMGHTDTTDRGDCEVLASSRMQEGAAQHRVAGIPAFCSLLLNGAQLVRCPYPEAGRESSVTVAAEDLNVSGEVGGMGVDLLFVSSHHSYSYDYELRARLVVASSQGKAQEVSIGRVQYSGETVHLSCHLEAPPSKLKFIVAHAPFSRAAESAAERQFVKDVELILRSPRLNREGGSLNAVLLSSKAKESVLYDEVVGGKYNGVWLDFIRQHSSVFTLFQYDSQEIKARELAPHIKKGDARVHLSRKTLAEVHHADQLRSRRGREGEAELVSFMSQTLEEGSISQKDLLTRLQGCKGFTSLLFPTLTLLMRFLSKHKDTFVWFSEPDQPVRIGVSSRRRRICHEASDTFSSVCTPGEEVVLVQTGAPVPPSPETSTYCHDPYSLVAAAA